MLQSHVHVDTRRTPQSQSIPARNDQVKNNAGGFVFQITQWDQLDRFLILGTEKGTYYATEQKLTTQNFDNVLKCIREDGVRTVKRIVEISDEGRAPKNDQALFALALALSHGNAETKRLVRTVFPKVARIATHLFDFLTYVQTQRGWGPALRKTVQGWYESKDAPKLEVQVTKYRNRNGWTHRDVLRKSHVDPNRVSIESAKVLQWAARNPKAEKDWEPTPQIPLIQTFEALRNLSDHNVVNGTIDAIQRNKNLTWEMLPDAALKSPEVWEALLPQMPITALIRNLGRLTANATLRPLSSSIGVVTSKLTDLDVLRKGRVHPVHVLAALNTYTVGRGIRGNLTWSPVGQITDALEDAFTKSFKAVEPTNKTYLVGLDVSGSMAQPANGMVGISCASAAAAMCMVWLRTEPQTHVMGFENKFVDLGLNARMGLKEVMERTRVNNFGSTDCALPIQWAERNNIDVDVFVVYTDNETWAGRIHPSQALRSYRQKKNPTAKLVVCGMTATNFSIADPEDGGMLDVVGFDSAVPKIIAGFATGK